eukprot:scaffold83279_cov69-Phaeocystis_antarctica.AAC.1
MRDSVRSRQLGPSAGRAVGPPAVAAAVGGAPPPVLGQVGAYKHSTECRAVCAAMEAHWCNSTSGLPYASTAECTEGEHIARSRLHAVTASRQARLGKQRRALGVDEAQRVRAKQ